MINVAELLKQKASEEQERTVGRLVLMLPKSDLKLINQMIRSNIERIIKEKKQNASVQQEDNSTDGV